MPALATTARTPGAHVGDDENQMTGENVNKIRRDGERGQKHQNIFPAKSVRQIAPHGGQDSRAGVRRGDDKANGDRRVAELTQINRKNHAQIGKRKGPDAAGDH